MAASPYSNVQHWRQITDQVLQRDGWLCQLCRQPIDPHARARTGDQGVADHVQPWEDGGAWYNLANLRAAHQRCNVQRANRRRASDRAEYVPLRQW